MATTTMGTTKDSKRTAYWMIVAAVVIIAAFAIFANGRRSTTNAPYSTNPAATVYDGNRNPSMTQTPAEQGAGEDMNRGTMMKNNQNAPEGPPSSTETNSPSDRGTTTPDTR